jgi:UDP-glucose 6-dehydrogenase
MINCEETVLSMDITFITVAIPSQLDGSIDLRHIKNSATEIGEALNKKDTYHLVVVKSTVFAEKLNAPFLSRISPEVLVETVEETKSRERPRLRNVLGDSLDS